VVSARGDKIIKVAKGSVQELISQVQPAGCGASPRAPPFPCGERLQDQTSAPTAARGNRVLFPIATLNF